MGDAVEDQIYQQALEVEGKEFGKITDMINSLPMGKNGKF
jgi:hypothetical protein